MTNCDDCNIPRLCTSIECVENDGGNFDGIGTRHVCDSCKTRYKQVWILKE